MNSPDKKVDPQEFEQRVKPICDIYHQAQSLHEQGVHVVSCDEKTGIQAVEREAPTKPMKPGLVERQEFNYIRHGTLALIANLEVATGRIITPSIGPTRNEQDFVHHIANTIDTDPQATWIFVTDQLNTHQSASLVEEIARRCGIAQDLGVKGEHGILKDIASRRSFLEDQSHRIRFVFTPRHASWLNQIEIWFSILARRVLRRGNFASLEELKARLLGFIDYFNKQFAKPFKWVYQAKPSEHATAPKLQSC